MKKKLDIEREFERLELVSQSCNFSASEGYRSWMVRASVRAEIDTLLFSRSKAYPLRDEIGRSLFYYWLPSKGGVPVYLEGCRTDSALRPCTKMCRQNNN